MMSWRVKRGMIGAVAVRALTWNLFHGRDFPPNPALRTWRSRLTRRSERDTGHMQVNRDLVEEFASLLAGWSWDVALLQECPPRWSRALAAACHAAAHRVLTSRNWLLPVTSAIAEWNPDLIASWEGGSNLTLVRGARIDERRLLVLRRLPERRVAAFTRLETGLCIVNLHASNFHAADGFSPFGRGHAADLRWRPEPALGGQLDLRRAGAKPRPRATDARRDRPPARPRPRCRRAPALAGARGARGRNRRPRRATLRSPACRRHLH